MERKTGYIPVVDPVTPDWLTRVLRQAGVLAAGEVASVAHERTGAFNSRTSHLALTYSADTPAGAPARLVLKRNTDAAWAIEAGAREVRFYACIASLADHPDAIVPCYAAAYDEVSGNSYLLLQDLSETHRPPVTRAQQIGIVDGVPAQEHIERVVDALARLHAYWWEHPLLATEVARAGRWFEVAWPIERYVRSMTSLWSEFVAREEADLPRDVRQAYETTLAHLTPFWERHLEPRFRSGANLTLTHGDAYFCNFLCPRAPGSGPTYLLDWQSPEVGIGAFDLVNLCAAFWTRAQRHEGRREEWILRRYHEVVRSHGVATYAWDDLLIDYRIGLIDWIFYPVWDSNNGSGKDYWWPKMQCLMSAFRDWRCEDLLTT